MGAKRVIRRRNIPQIISNFCNVWGKPRGGSEIWRAAPRSCHSSGLSSEPLELTELTEPNHHAPASGADVLILGCGFTGQRVAASILEQGARVVATTRHPDSAAMQRLQQAGAIIISLDQVPEHIRSGVRVLHSIPIIGGEPEESITCLDLLGDAPRRVVYISTTGVYGSAEHVDASTPVDRTSERARARLAVEEAVANGSWSTPDGSMKDGSIILRAAAIYGPGRGVHIAYKLGKYPRHQSYVSRIHVDDLAAHAEAALFSTVTGAYAVADEEPCTSAEIFDFCAELLGPPDVPPQRAASRGPVRFSANRRVDGSAVRKLLGIRLRYPSYRTGIPASIEAARTSE